MSRKRRPHPEPQSDPAASEPAGGSATPASEGILVDSGSFRVDRSRALQKLQEFQLPDPDAFLLPWLRLAAVSEASTVSLSEIPGGLELRFDGKPLGRRQLRDPYDCLFSESVPDAPRYRHLAVGLLAALRLSPKRVTVTSGLGSERVRLEADSIERDRLVAAADGDSPTILQAAWDGWFQGLKRLDCIAKAKASAGLLEPAFAVSGEPAAPLGDPKHPEQPLALAFADGSVRGVLLPPASLGNASAVKLYKHGVLVSEASHSLPLAEVEAHVNDDGFDLDASHSRVVQNQKLDAALRGLADPGRRLVLRGAQEQVVSYPALAEPVFREGSKALGFFLKLGRWARGGMIEAAFAKWGGDEAALRFLRWDSRVTAWLRDAARRLLADSDKDSQDPLKKALWDAPVYLSVAGRPLSLREIERQYCRIGYVPASTAIAAGSKIPMDILWCPADDDAECLKALFPDHLRWMSDLVGSLPPPDR